MRATYPEIRVETSRYAQVDSRLSYGHVAAPGVYSATVTQPSLCHAYLIDQIRLIIRNHGVPVEVGPSAEPIPLHFAFSEAIHVEGEVADRIRRPLRDMFDVPDLAVIDDAIVNGTYSRRRSARRCPLAPFTASRVDYSLSPAAALHRDRRRTIFQNFVIFTNYQFYVDEFVAAQPADGDAGRAATRASSSPAMLITPSRAQRPVAGIRARPACRRCPPTISRGRATPA